MSRPIAESLSLLSETLDNCKTNLKEKEVADVDNIKISDVDEKIAEIEAGGGDEFSCTFNSIKFYKEIDDDESNSIFNDAYNPVTVTSEYATQSNGANLDFQKIIFDLTINNAPTDKSSIYNQSNVHLLDDFKTASHSIETEGNLKTGSGNLKITIKYNTPMGFLANVTNDFCYFYFGNNAKYTGTAKIDGSKIVHYQYYRMNN